MLDACRGQDAIPCSLAVGNRVMKSPSPCESIPRTLVKRAAESLQYCVGPFARLRAEAVLARRVTQ